MSGFDSDGNFVAIPNLLPLVYWPDPKLSQECKEVEIFDNSIEQLAADLTYTMLKNNGLGLSAPQVGTMLNVIVIAHLTGEEYEPFVLINPTIEVMSNDGKYSTSEGCLSVPGYFEVRERPKCVKVWYYDLQGILNNTILYDINAFVVQHEMDHLQGKVFVDGLSKLKRDRIINKIKKVRKFGK